MDDFSKNFTFPGQVWHTFKWALWKNFLHPHKKWSKLSDLLENPIRIFIQIFLRIKIFTF